MIVDSTWGQADYEMTRHVPGRQALRRLVDGKQAVVVLRNLLPAEAFTVNHARLRTLFEQATTTRYANGALTTIGPYLAKHVDQPEAYFREATAASAWTDSVSFDLSARVRQGLRTALGLQSFEVAQEPDGRQYADSVVRIHADGVANPLHNDNIMRDASSTSLRLAALKHQLSCVVCIQECDSGGELKIYRKRWEPSDEEHKIPGGLGYRNAVVDNAPCHEFKPRAGDIYLINPTHYHEIARVSGADRLTLGFFIGFADDNLDNAIAWG